MAVKLACAILLASLCSQTLAQGELRAGDQLPALTLQDQHEKAAGIPAGTRQLLFAADNGGAGLVTDLLDRMESDWLAQTQRVYLADIHKMPGLIARMIALPKLREKPYPIVLGREEADLAMFPRTKDCVTVIPVQEGKLGSAVFACSADALRTAISPSTSADRDVQKP